MVEQDFENAGLPADSVGRRLSDARKAAGLSRSELADRTKIAERHLVSLEEGRFSDLVSRAYVVGFSRSYARALGLDEGEIVQAVRRELAESEDDGQRLKAAVFEPGDPARIPGLSLAGVAALGALLVVVLVFVFWRSYYVPELALPDLIHEEKAPPPPAAPAPRPSLAPATLPSAAAGMLPPPLVPAAPSAPHPVMAPKPAKTPRVARPEPSVQPSSAVTPAVAQEGPVEASTVSP